MKKTRTIGVLMGGCSRERDVSFRTGRAVLAALDALGYRTTAIEVDRHFLSQVPTLAIDVAFIALHGTFGEDGRVQALLEWAGIPYTGSGVLTSALCFQKHALKRFLASYGVPMAKDWVYERPESTRDSAHLADFIAGETWSFPLIVKPASEGSSIGVSRVFGPSELLPALSAALETDRCALVESFIGGREVTVSVLNGEVLPILEVAVPDGFYDYTAKYQSKTTQYSFPTDLPASTVDDLVRWSRDIFHWVGARGAIRLDWIVPPMGAPVFLEVNTIPGMTETSLLPKAAAKIGLSFDALVERILDAAMVAI